MGIWELVRTERSFRYVWLSQVVSELGDWFQLVALVSMFPTRGKGAAVVALLVGGRHVVAALVTPVAGIIADRFPRGRVMFVADVARALNALGFLLVRGPEDVGLVLGLSYSLEALAVVFEPARGAVIPQIVPSSKLYAANALGSATWSAVLALGALAGGATAALLGRRAAYVLNALSFVASAALVLAARLPPLNPRDAAEPAPHPIRDLRAGLSYLRTHPAQASLLVLKPGALLSGGFFVLVSVFADQVFRGDPALIMGLLLGGRGCGALVFPFVVHHFSGSSTPALGRTLLAVFPVSLLAFAAFSAAPNVAVACAALFVAHGGTSVIWTSSSQLLQTTVPNRVLGRVLSVELALLTLAIALASGAVALLLDGGLGPRLTATALACSLAVPTLAWWRALRRHGSALERAAATQLHALETSSAHEDDLRDLGRGADA